MLNNFQLAHFGGDDDPETPPPPAKPMNPLVKMLLAHVAQSPDATATAAPNTLSNQIGHADSESARHSALAKGAEGDGDGGERKWHNRVQADIDATNADNLRQKLPAERAKADSVRRSLGSS